MSATIDEKVVEMRFDNRNFEKNVKTTMSSLDRLKQKLKLDGATKGLQDVSRAANNISLDHIASGVEQLQKRFSTFGIVGMRVVENVTDSVISLFKKTNSYITSTIKSGGISRAMNLENANFQLMGLLKNEKDVAAVMEDVSYGVDGTAYGLDAAAKVASQLAASGMRAGDSMKSALRGISGVAAMTNSSYEDIGRIYTQIAGQGRMMGDQLLQLSGRGMNAAATLAEYLTKVGNGAKVTEADVRDMVSKGKIDFDTFATAMDETFGEHAKKANETFNGAMSNVKSALSRIGAEFISPLIKQNGPLVELLNALRVKINDIKANIGPFAQVFTTGVTRAANALTKFVNGIDVSKIFEKFSGLNSKWDNLISRITSAGVTEEDFNNKLIEVAKSHGIAVDDLISKYGTIGKVFAAGKLSGSIIIETIKKLAGAETEASKATDDITDKVEYFNDVVGRVIRGDFGNNDNEKRMKALTEAGYDFATVQGLVNKVWERNGHNWSNTTLSAEELTEAIASLSDSELKNAGYTDEQVKKLKELAKEAEKTGTPLSELITQLEKPSGKELILDSLGNSIKGCIKFAKTFKQAFSEMFEPITSDTLYNLTESINKFSKHLVMSDDTADKLKRTIKGVIALLDMVTNVLGGGLKFGIKVVSTLLKYFNIDLLSVTAKLGDFLVDLRDATDFSNLFGKAMDKLGPHLQKAADAVNEWIDGLKAADNIPEYILKGLINGIKNGATTAVQSIVELGKMLLEGIRDVLGIHSPSTKFFEIGRFIVQGLINGIKDGFSTVINTIKSLCKKCISSINEIDFGGTFTNSVGNGVQNGFSNILNFIKSLGKKCIDGIKSLNFGKAFAVGIGTGMLAVTYKMADGFKTLSKAIEAFSAPAKGVGKLLTSFGSVFDSISASITKRAKAKNFETVSKGVLNIAFAMGIFAASLAVLSKIDETSLGNAMVAIDIMAATLVGLSLALSKMDKFGDFSKPTVSILAIGASLLLVSEAMSKLNGMNPDQMKTNLLCITGILALLTTVALALSNFSKGPVDIAGSGKTMLAMSVALLVMVRVIKQVDGLEASGIAKGLTVIGLLGTFFTVMVKVSEHAGANGKKAGSMLLKMSFALAIMVGVIKLAGKLEADEIVKGTIVVGVLGVLFKAIVKVSQYAGEHGAKAGSMILKISIALMAMVGVIKLISYISDDEISRGMSVIIKMELMFVALIAVSNFAGENAAKAGAMLLMMSGALVVLTGVLFVLSKIEPDGLGRALAAVSVLELLFAGLIAVTKYAKDCKNNLVVMTVAIGLLAGAIVALSFIKPERLAAASLALTSVMATFALMIKVTQVSKNTKQMIRTLGTMMGVVALLAGIITAMSFLNGNSAIKSSAALSVLLLAFASSIAILGKTDRISKTVTDNLYTMTGVVGVLALILSAMSALNLEGSIQSATAIGLLLNSMATAFVILGQAKKIDKSVMSNMLVMSGVVAILGTILGVMDALNVEGSIQTAISLGVLLNAMAAAMIVLGLAKGADAKAIGYMALMGLVVAELAAILGVMDKLGVEASIPTAIALSTLLLAMSGALVILGLVGAMGAAAFIGIGALATLIAGIGGLIVGIGALMEKVPQLEEFLDKGIPVIEKIGNAIGSFFGNIVSGFMTGVADGLPEIGTKLSQFMVNASPFIMTAKTIDPSAMDGVKSMAEALLVLTAANLLDQLTSWITGGVNFEDFGNKMKGFGEAIGEFSSAVKGKVDGDAVQDAANAGKMLAALNKELPKEGGFVQAITGESHMDTFSANIVKFGNAIVEFSDTVAGKVDPQGVEDASNAGKMLAELNSSLPKSDGVWQLYTGEQDMGTFATNIVAFGNAIKEFSGTVTGNISLESIQAAANAGTMLTTLQSSIDPIDGIIQKFKGQKDLATFGEKILKFGQAMVDFSEEVSGNINQDAVDSAARAGNILADLHSKLSGTEDSKFKKLKKFGSSLKDFGKNMKKFAKEIVDVDTVSLAAFTAQVRGLYDLVSGIDDTDVSGLSTFIDNLNNIGSVSLDGFVASFTDSDGRVSMAVNELLQGIVINVESKKQQFLEAGKTLIESLRNGIAVNANQATTAVSSIMRTSLSYVRSYYSSFYSAGSYIVDGFANGVDDHAWRGISKVRQMAKNAETAARKELEVKSPSRKFTKIGYYTVMGFVNGIDRFSYLADRSSRAMANSALQNTQAVISQIGESLDASNFDYEPTIRPVVDTSDVLASASMITNMFNGSGSIALRANAQYASKMANNQNGMNDDIISAIGKLSDKFNMTPGNTYTINGMTYDDGSNIAEAMQTIFRATRIEGRM